MAGKIETSIDNVLNDLKNKIFHPIYLLHGEESYFIDLLSDEIEKQVLNDLEKEFNQTIVYGKDTDVPTLISYARRFPMMANYQVLIVKELQDMDKLEKLQVYTDNPLSSTILVLCHKYAKLDKRKVFYKSIEKHGVIFESNRLYDNKIPEWITGYLEQSGYPIHPKAALLLTDFLGADLGKIVNEIRKLLINLVPGTLITEEIVEKNIGISKDFNVFELQKALIQKDVVDKRKWMTTEEFVEFATLAQTLGLQEGSYRVLPIRTGAIATEALPTRLSMLTTSRLRVSSIWVNRSKDSRLYSCLGFFWA